MTRLYQWLRTKPKITLIGALVVLVALAVLWVAVRQGLIAATWTAVTTLPPQIWVPLVAAILTAFVSVGTVVYAKDREHKREIAQQQRAQKADAYQEFMNYWFKVLRRKPGKTTGAEKAERHKIDEKYRTEVPQKLVLWASEPVIREYNAYMRLDRTEEVTMFEFERILFTLREDLGYSNEGLKTGDLLHLFLQGVEQALRERQE